jgi:hypothetical protein
MIGHTPRRCRIQKRTCADRETDVLDVTEYIDGFYKLTRRHGFLGGAFVRLSSKRRAAAADQASTKS